MNRFEYASPNLALNEVVTTTAMNVKLYDGEVKTSFEGGEVTVTSHRILWAKPGDFSQGLTCLCLPLHYVVFIEEEIPGALQFTRSSKLVLHLSPAVDGRNPGPVQTSFNNFVKLSFKNGLETSFISGLNNAIHQKKWESVQKDHTHKSAYGGIKPRVGIVGIERGIQEKQKATDESISTAFQDLSKLMEMAKDMVKLSKNISTKIREKQGSISEDETLRFKSYLLSLGIDDPVTRGSNSSESDYMTRLARQVVEILETPIREQGGMMSLVDAYCRVNRARGLELLSPEDLLMACRLLQDLNLPISLRKFDSGVMVLQLSELDDTSIVKSTSQLIKEKGSLTSEELAQLLGISVLLAKERLTTTEKQGCACRDESIEGLRFYPNLFLERETGDM